MKKRDYQIDYDREDKPEMYCTDWYNAPHKIEWVNSKPTSFRRAKREAIEHLKSMIENCRDSIKELRQLKKEDVTYYPDRED